MTRRRRHGERGDEGSVSVFLVITVVGLVVLIGLVADGGAKLRATQQADSTAAEAARAGGQALNLAQVVAGDGARVDRTLAVAAARDYLAAAGASGTVIVDPSNAQLVVTVTDTAPTAFLGLIGIDQLAVTGSARVTLVEGITGAAP